jgi:hypothetical protein
MSNTEYDVDTKDHYDDEDNVDGIVDSDGDEGDADADDSVGKYADTVDADADEGDAGAGSGCDTDTDEGGADVDGDPEHTKSILKNTKPSSDTSPKDSLTHVYETAYMHSCDKFKKMIINYMMTRTNEYIGQVRDVNDKKPTVDAQSKEQIMYVIYRLMHIVSRMDKHVHKKDDITGWIAQSLDTKSYDYKLYHYVTTATEGVAYNLIGEDIEHHTLMYVNEVTDDEDLQQHITELFLTYVNRLSYVISCFNYASTKRVSSTNIHGMIRSLSMNTNPEVYTNILGYVEFQKKKNTEAKSNKKTKV